MLYTVSDFCRTYERSLRAVAGSSGFSRAVASVGILDYELVPGLSDRYRQRNFDENMVVLTRSFMRKTTRT